MGIRIAINGFGRIGRTLTRQLITNIQLRQQYEVVACNDLQPLETLLYLFKYDTVHGKLPVEYFVMNRGNGYVDIFTDTVRFFSTKEPENLPWKELDIDIVVDGIFPTYPLLAKHLEAGAKRVVLTAPAKDREVFTFTPNVKEENLTANHLITSNTSCTTNAVAPIIKAVLLPLDINHLQVGTIHAYTASQALIDTPMGKKDLRGSRAAAENIIPSTTGASTAIPLLFPELEGKVDGYSIRVPIPCGSLAILTAEVSKRTSKEEVNHLLREASLKDEWRWRRILGVSNDPLVSSDIVGNIHGSLVDLGMTSVIDGHMVTIGAWYDNEWGYCSMLINHIKKVAEIAGFTS